MKYLNKYILCGLMSAGSLGILANDLPVGSKADSYLGVTVENIAPTDNGNIEVDLTVDASHAKIKSQLQQVFTPYITDGNDTVWFESFSVIGRKRLISNERNNRPMSPLTFTKGNTGTTDLTLIAPWQDWMNDATFGIDSETFGCANCLKNPSEQIPLAETQYVELSYFPEYIYVTPQAEAIKTRDISARAYIDFVVNRTEINPTYRRNPVELAKIRATIDSVNSDKDITITKLHISGTASPEGSYDNNVRLAKGRTESLKNYVQGLYRFPAGLITSSYEPVDWEGLSQFLRIVIGIRDEVLGTDSIRQDQFAANSQIIANEENNNSPISSNTLSQSENSSLIPYTSYLQDLPHAREILNIVNGDLEPYARNSKIRSTYPKEYQWLLTNVYPALRHSDYRIEFEIKHYTEAPEIIEVMQTNPSKLSLEELFVAANSQPEGSELYNRAFELAVTMYPQDETANLNAGIAAMKRGDLVTANRYLAKAGQTPEAEYARGMLMLIEGNQEGAEDVFNVLSMTTNPTVSAKATEAKNEYERIKRENGFHFRKL